MAHYIGLMHYSDLPSTKSRSEVKSPSRHSFSICPRNNLQAFDNTRLGLVFQHGVFPFSILPHQDYIHISKPGLDTRSRLPTRHIHEQIQTGPDRNVGIDKFRRVDIRFDRTYLSSKVMYSSF